MLTITFWTVLSLITIVFLLPASIVAYNSIVWKRTGNDYRTFKQQKVSEEKKTKINLQ